MISDHNFRIVFSDLIRHQPWTVADVLPLSPGSLILLDPQAKIISVGGVEGFPTSNKEKQEPVTDSLDALEQY